VKTSDKRVQEVLRKAVGQCIQSQRGKRFTLAASQISAGYLKKERRRKKDMLKQKKPLI